MIIEIVNDTDFPSNRLKYVIYTLFNIAGLSLENDLKICYGPEISGNYDIYILSKPFRTVNHSFGEIIKTDIVKESFNLLTCSEEYNSPKDKIGRFLAAYSSKNIGVPVVNYLALQLKEAIDKVARRKGIELKQFNRQFTVVLSHDVDNITDRNFYVFCHRVVNVIKYLKVKKFKEGLRHFLFTLKRLISLDNPYWNFEEYMKIEDRYGFRSSFYFINGKKGRHGARYRLTKVKDVILKLVKSDWEIGLHTNYFSYDQPSKIIKERNNLKEISGVDIIGNRNHYLRFKVPFTWEALKEAGFKYDTTLGYSDSIGFRGGVAFPFCPYNLIKDEVLDLLEIPMVVMDGTLFKDQTNIESTWEKVKNILEETKKVNGTIAVNFHQRVLYQDEFFGWKDIYLMILNYIKDNNGRAITGESLYREIRNENNYNGISD